MFEPAAVSSQLDESVSPNGEMAEYLSSGNIELAAQQATTVLSVVNNADNSQMQLERKIKVGNSLLIKAIINLFVCLFVCLFVFVFLLFFFFSFFFF